MKLEPQKTQVISANLQEKETFTSQINDSAIIIDYLRNKMYSNKIQTPVQEYMSNALDAMKQVGNKGKIRVTLPTGIKREIRIRDFGPGLDEKGMKEVFSQYAASNKTHTDGQIGGYGLGSKSGWAYGPVFMVNSYFDGKKRVYVAQIADNQEGKFSLETVLETKEPNGLEIIIPVTREEDIRKFVKAVFRAGCLWDNQPEIVEESLGYEKIYDVINNPVFKGEGFKVYKKERIVEDIFSFGYSQPKIMLSCDGIPYPLPEMSDSEFPMVRALSEFFNEAFIVLDFKTGEVAIQPDRERVAGSDVNKENIYKKIKEIYSKLLRLRVRRFYNPVDIHSYAGKIIEDRKLFKNNISRTSQERSMAREYGRKNVFSKKSGITTSLDTYSYEQDKYKFLLEERYGNFSLHILNLKYGKEKVFSSKGHSFSRELISYSMNGSKFNKSEVKTLRHGVVSLPVKYENNKLVIDSSSTTYVKLDEETTNYMIRRKVKHYISEGFANEVIVLPEGFIESLPFDYPEKTICISSMSLPEKQTREKETGFGYYALEHNWYKSHPVRKRRNIHNLENNKQKYVYMTLEKNKAPSYYDELSYEGQSGLVKYFTSENYQLILVAQSAVDKIKDDKNFISFEEYRESKMEGDTIKMEIAKAINMKHYAFSWLDSVCVSEIKNLKFDAFKDFYWLIQSVKGSKALPKSLVKEKEENQAKVEAVVKFQNELNEYLSKNFKLLKTLSKAYLKDEEKLEVIDYINDRYASIVKESNIETIPEIEAIVNN